MDETKKAIQDFFLLLKEKFFSDVVIDSVINMTEAQQERFILEQTERLLDGDASAAKALSGYFWTDKDGRNRNKKSNNPLMEPKAREVMDDDERLLCSFYLTLAGFCHDLAFHFTFDPMVLGLSAPDEFFVDNAELVDFVLHSKYERIAAHVACIMKKQAVEAMEDAGYQVARDYINKVWYEDGKVWVKEPNDKGVPAKEYAKLVIDALNKVEEHLRDGLQRNIPQDVIFVHDELYGKVTDKYDSVALSAAKEIVNYIDNTTYRKSTGQMAGKTEAKHINSKEAFLHRFEDKLNDIKKRTDNTELFSSVAMKYLNGRIEQKFID